MTTVIKTSYFASKAPKESKVIIAKGRPRFFPKATLWVKELAPSDPFTKDWQASYRRDLAERFPDGKGLAELLKQIAKQVPSPILCCYEKNREECHRSLLANYIKKHLDINIEEWTPDHV